MWGNGSGFLLHSRIGAESWFLVWETAPLTIRVQWSCWPPETDMQTSQGVWKGEIWAGTKVWQPNRAGWAPQSGKNHTKKFLCMMQECCLLWTRKKGILVPKPPSKGLELSLNAQLSIRSPFMAKTPLFPNRWISRLWCLSLHITSRDLVYHVWPRGMLGELEIPCRWNEHKADHHQIIR